MTKIDRNIKLVIIMLLSFTIKVCQAQYSKDTAGNYSTSYIDIPSLIGYWQTTDSTHTRLEFIDTCSYQIILDLKDRSHPYYFIKSEEDNSKVSSSGYFANWPPFNANLYLIDSDTLEIRLSQVGETTYIYRCKKIR